MSAWYEQSFGEDYLLVYKHRDYSGAVREVKVMADWLSLAPGSKILDLCCGMGRHSLALAGFGYDVTGVDLSKVLLEEAGRTDVEASIRWIRGDMRQVPLDSQFDAVVNLFTSFGYFDTDEEHALVLAEIDRLLKQGGRFLIDFLNPGYVRRTLAASSERTDGDVRIRERRRIDNDYVRKEITIDSPNGPERRYQEQVRLYELADFERLLAGTSLVIDRVYGDYEGMPYSEDLSSRLILVGTKRGKAGGNPQSG